jgi:CP family cyanate transporter-like MFS transporter
MDSLTDQSCEPVGRTATTILPASMWKKLLQPALAVAAVIFIGFNLRPSITTVALFLADIRRDFGLSAFAISVLTMTPVLCLGLFAPLAPPLVRRFGTETVMFASLIGIAGGSLVRALGVGPLYGGTVIIGACLCLLGVLTPVMVRQKFPRQVGPMMGIYTMMVCIGPAVGASTAIPLQRALGSSWELVLLGWGLPALIAALVFIPQFFRNGHTPGLAIPRVHGLMRDPLAWQVTGFFALISALAYGVFSWAPTMVVARGLDPTTAGVIVSIGYLSQMVAGLGAPILAGRRRDQRLILAAVAVMTALGLFGYTFAPIWSLALCSVVLGLGQGGAFGVALLLFVVRTGDSHSATKLSALAQTIGYVVSGFAGPFAVGLIYEWTQSWGVVEIFFGIIGLGSLLCGLGAGRDRTVKVEHRHG